MASNTKKLYTIVPNAFAEGLYIFTKYENGRIVESYGIFEEEVPSVNQKAKKEGYNFAKDINFLKEEIARYQYILNDLQSQLDEAIASGNYIEGEN